MPVNTRERELKERCERFGALVSHLDFDALTERQREVAKLRIAGLSLKAIGAQLGISGERVRQIESRIRSRARRSGAGFRRFGQARFRE